MFGDLVAHGLRSFGVIGTQVHIHESPRMLVGNLRTQAVHVIVIAGNADDLCSVNLRSKDLGGFQIGRNEDASFESATGSLGRDCIGQVAGGRTAHNLEAEISGLRQGHSHHAVLKTQRREADGIVLDVERLTVELLAQSRSFNQGSKAHGEGRLKVFRQW